MSDCDVVCVLAGIAVEDAGLQPHEVKHLETQFEAHRTECRADLSVAGLVARN